MGDLISIIVPVYNVESYLEQCIDSILAQSYKNLEIILVDDGSTDQSGEICDRYAEKDSRICVVHQASSGSSSARNAGLKICHGNYLGFIDSDDYIASDMYKILLDNLLREDADISVCGAYDVFPDYIEASGNEKAYFTLSGKKAAKGLFVRKKFFSRGEQRVVWNKLYKRSVFFPKDRDCIAFPEETNYGVDNYVTPMILYRARRVVYSGRNLYFYRQRKGSVVHNFGKHVIIGYRDYILNYYKWTEKEASDLRANVECFNLREFYVLVKNYIRSQSYPLWLDDLKQLNDIIVEQTKTIFKDEDTTFKDKKIYFLMKSHLLIKQKVVRTYFKNLRPCFFKKNKGSKNLF